MGKSKICEYVDTWVAGELVRLPAGNPKVKDPLNNPLHLFLVAVREGYDEIHDRFNKAARSPGSRPARSSIMGAPVELGGKDYALLSDDLSMLSRLSLRAKSMITLSIIDPHSLMAVYRSRVLTQLESFLRHETYQPSCPQCSTRFFTGPENAIMNVLSNPYWPFRLTFTCPQCSASYVRHFSGDSLQSLSRCLRAGVSTVPLFGVRFVDNLCEGWSLHTGLTAAGRRSSSEYLMHGRQKFDGDIRRSNLVLHIFRKEILEKLRALNVKVAFEDAQSRT
jgi:uncharacterized protein with PIN domain